MKRIRSRQELFIYALLWLLPIAAPMLVIGQQVLSGHASSFDWDVVWQTWLRLLPFLLAFVLHNWLLAPLLVVRRRQVLYYCGAAMIVGVFMLYECQQGPGGPKHRGGPPHELREGRPPMAPDEGDFEMEGPRPHFEHPRHDGPRRPDGRPRPDDHPRPDSRPDGQRPPILVGHHDLISLAILLLMLGLNLGIKYYFKQRDDAHRLELLEYERVQQQLAYLRYQINPHFLMNTLNNIHALIDINPEQAQESIVELSRLLRYILYDGERDLVPVQREVEFVQHFIDLMRIRYTDTVDVRYDVSMENAAATMPPLILVAFVENAFKHGVSYQQASFVHIAIEATAERLHFTCRNSKKVQTDGGSDSGGLGLRNVRERLDLLFADAYRLDINDGADVYSIDLEIPITS